MNEKKWQEDFIKSICISKSRIEKCINIIIHKKGYVFDDVLMIGTYEMNNGDISERCKNNQVLLSLEFPGYPEEISYVNYNELYNLIKNNIDTVIKKFSDNEKNDLIKMLDIARESI